MSIEDRAQDHEAKLWEMANAPRPERPTYGPEHPLYGPENCEGCEATMPVFRRRHGWQLCTECQSDAEKTMGRQRR